MNAPDVSAGEKMNPPRKPRWPRYGTRLLFVTITVVAIPLAVTMKRLHDHKAAIKKIQSVGGTMGYSLGGPEWLRKIVRDDECFYEPQRVTLGPLAKDNPELDDDILASVSKSLVSFHELQALDIRRSEITDRSAPILARLTTITHLRLAETRISDKTVNQIKQLPKLESLLLANTRLTDDCVEDLCAIQTLTGLDIRGTQISADGLTRLQAGLPACKISY